jgi:hypothetical protein
MSTFPTPHAFSMAELPLTGGCLCGGVRFRVDAPLVSATYCHCTRCQRRTGTAASAQARIQPGSLTVTQGEELIRTYAPPDGFSKLFCGACGSALWSRSPDDPELVSVRLGAFDGDPGIRPSHRQYVAYAAAWEDIPDDGLPRYDERP